MTRPQAVVAGHYMHVVTELFGNDAALAVWDAVPEWMQAPARAIESGEPAVEEACSTEEAELVTV
jgi:hypothetical protein